MHASVAAQASCSRAALSPRTAGIRLFAVSRSASRLPESLHGLAPWLIGRDEYGTGFCLPVYGRAVYDSSAWQRTSKPLAATTSAGSVRVQVGSTTASVGRSRAEAMPVLARKESTSQTAMPVVSLPVPQVVGQAMCGGRGPGTGAPPPTGLFT